MRWGMRGTGPEINYRFAFMPVEVWTDLDMKKRQTIWLERFVSLSHWCPPRKQTVTIGIRAQTISYGVEALSPSFSWELRKEIEHIVRTEEVKAEGM